MMILQLSEWAGHHISIGPVVNGVDPVAHTLEASDERVVLDLRVGDTYQRDHQYTAMPEVLVLRPGECVRLRTRELIRTPSDVFGLVCSRASLTAQGLFVSNIKVDPLFAGRLEVAVLNGGSRPIRIRQNMRFASLFFLTMASPVIDNITRSPTATSGVAFNSWRERFRMAAPYIATVAASVVASIASTIITG